MDKHSQEWNTHNIAILEDVGTAAINFELTDYSKANLRSKITIKCYPLYDIGRRLLSLDVELPH